MLMCLTCVSEGKSVFDDGFFRVEAEPESVDLIIQPKGPAIDGIVRSAARSGIETARRIPTLRRRFFACWPLDFTSFIVGGLLPEDAEVLGWQGRDQSCR